MKKKAYKIIAIFLLIMTVFSLTYVYADDPLSVITSRSPGPEALNQMNSLRGKIYTIVRTIGVGISVIALLALAIKYIISSPNDRADLKKYMITFAISAGIFYGAIGIIEIIRAFGQEILK